MAGEAVEPTPIKAHPCCPRQPGVIVDKLSGRQYRAKCGTWSCPVCGHQKRRRLVAATIRAFDQEKFLSLWTFTVSSGLGWTIDEHARVMLSAWRRFVVKVRQKWLGRITTQGLKMFRVVEQHKSGALHFHVLMNRFLNKERVKFLWMVCVIRAAEAEGLEIPPDRKFSDANVAPSRNRGKPSAKAVACYVAKYVTKTLAPHWSSNSGSVPRKLFRRVWSASRGFVSLAYKSRSYNSVKCWAFHRGMRSCSCDDDSHRLYLFPLRVMLQPDNPKYDDPDPFDRWKQPALWSF